MFHRWAALVLVLALCAMTPKHAAGQHTQQSPREHSAGAFVKAYPNPFNPQVFIPFTTCCWLPSVQADASTLNGMKT